MARTKSKKLFDYDGYLGDIAPLISNSTVKKFYTSPDDKISPKKVYEAVRNKILFFMDFGDSPEIADVMACWVIATYCYPLFYWFPHLLINAPSQSGKSKCGFILMQLSFRGFDLGASGGVTPAQIFINLFDIFPGTLQKKKIQTLTKHLKTFFFLLSVGFSFSFFR